MTTSNITISPGSADWVGWPSKVRSWRMAPVFVKWTV
jgi:hypothetical protein